MKVKGYIASLLLLCFSVYLGHNLVPHHHHAEVFKSPLTAACPFEHGDHQGHDHNSDSNSDENEHPTHCHAFNDVVFEKYSITLNYPGTSKIVDMEIPSQVFVLNEALWRTSSPFILLKLPDKSHIDLGTRALRGPPVLA